MRPPDEIVAIETTIQVPGGKLTKERFLRAGHIYVLQIGSGENCQVRNECLANLHASIEVHKQSAYITNHDHVVGTLVNGQRIHDRIKVRHGDEIKCGDMVLDLGFLHPNLEGETVLPDPKTPSTYHCNGCGGEWLLHPKDCTNRAHWDSHVGKLGESLVEQKRREEEKNAEIEGLSRQVAKLQREVEVQKANVEKGGETAGIVGDEINDRLAEVLSGAQLLLQGFEGGAIPNRPTLTRWVKSVDAILTAGKQCQSAAGDLLAFTDEAKQRDIETLRKERHTHELQFNAIIEICAKALEGVDIPKATAASSWAKILANQYRKVKAELDKLVDVGQRLTSHEAGSDPER